MYVSFGSTCGSILVLTVEVWWSLVDLAACAEVIYPRELPALAGEIAAGTYPLEPLTLSWA